METRRLGRGGPAVSALGLGCMAMSGAYGPVDDGESIATVHAALEAGVTLLDTGDFYGMGHNELLLRDALAGRRDRAFVSVKFGALWGPDRAPLGVDARPASVKSFLAYSLRRLGTDHVDLYQPARLDPTVPIEDTVGAIAELVQAGYVRHLGLSEVSAETLRRAHAVHPVAALQIEYSLLTRGIEAQILPTARELGVAVVAYGVLSRGLIGGAVASGDASGDASAAGARGHFPRFQGENLARNLALVDVIRALAEEKGATASQLAFAWVLAQGSDVIPLMGAKRRAHLADALGSLYVALTADDLARLDAALPPGVAAGDRYAAVQMARLDSERSMGD